MTPNLNKREHQILTLLSSGPKTLTDFKRAGVSADRIKAYSAGLREWGVISCAGQTYRITDLGLEELERHGQREEPRTRECLNCSETFTTDNRFLFLCPFCRENGYTNRYVDALKE